MYCGDSTSSLHNQLCSIRNMYILMQICMCVDMEFCVQRFVIKFICAGNQ